MSLVHKLAQSGRVIWAFTTSLTELVVRRPADRPARAAWLSKFCRKVLRAARVTWSVRGPIPVEGAVIGNHLTYLDILVHAALRPCVFVAAIETRRMPLIGWISMMAGTVYVTRGAGGSAAKAADGMAAGFRDHLPVTFFPEGGTGIGDQPLLPLHSGLLAAAIEEEAPVTAGYLRYQLSQTDIGAGKSTRNDVHWGAQTLPAHLWNFLGLHFVHAEIVFAPRAIDFSTSAMQDRKKAAEEAEHALLVVAGHGT